MNPGIRKMLDGQAALVERTAGQPEFTFGAVVATSPLVVHLDGEFDGEGAASLAPATSYAGVLPVGTVVVCMKQNRRVIVVAAAADTGWQTLPLAPGFEAYDPSRTPQYRVDRGICYLSGLVKPSTGTIANGQTFATLPVGARPRRWAVQPAVIDNFQRAAVTTSSSGQLQYTGSVTTGYVYLDGINFGV